MAKAEYRSALRSKKLITDALVALLDEKTLDKITVTDIVKKADINRGTFYAHYNNVSDVVTSIFAEAYNIITNSIHEFHDYSDFDMGIMLRELQVVMEKDFEFYKKIFSSDINMKIYEQISNVLISYVYDHESDISNISHADFVFYTSFYSGGIIKLYRDWFIGELPMTFDELTEKASDLLIDLKKCVME
ncbi:MAG: TetR/AcrR family transcriptional regulator C-terminal domain-containing protein [Agathobacter sp.]|nr:TetR/AcrR family transcriptional regulator C-terminal domain-containing protein [Agathobacter sp.]